MRYSKALIPTLRETPAEAEVLSHQLLLRGGFIRQVARGIYTYLPLGWRVLQKIMRIVREEHNAIGCEELQMPCLVPGELWEQSGRWQAYGKELLRLRDRHDREYCFGPTHEEVITSLAAATIRSYRELPKNLYQIHTKFRDEIRPRFGLMRGREFIMKDAYSFHASEADLDREYDEMCRVYQRIFARCGLSSRVVEAATGAIGGSSSHEVMVLADTGEAAIAHCACGYAANVELAMSRRASAPAASAAATPAPERVATPGLKTVDEVAKFLEATPEQLIKTLVFLRDDGVVVALIAGHLELNEHKLQAATGATFLTLADARTVEQLTGANVGFAGPVGLPREVAGVGPVTIIADTSVQSMMNAITGANATDQHWRGVAAGRDFVPAQYCDLSIVAAGDACPRCDDGKLEIVRGIEVGHIFKLGTKYSKAFGAEYLDAAGKSQTIIMGTYGLGIGRTAAAAIEQHHDDRGMIWPLPIAPFHAVVLLMNSKEPAHVAYAETVYQALTKAGLEVLYDDRAERAGVKFADAELIGIPYQVVIGSKGMAAAQVELKDRRTGQAALVSVEDVIATIHAALRACDER